jgi:ATP-dependent Clp protease ATP-binding subunit ClpA
MGKSKRETQVHTIVRQATVEARAAGLPTLEAEHLLLAIARQDGTPAQVILKDAGLDHDAIQAALRREFDQSLQAAGVSTAALNPAPAGARRHARHLRPGQSFKLAIQRAMQTTPGRTLGGRNLSATTLLFGVLRADAGTVPRALSFAGVDRAALLARTQEALAIQG